MLYIIIVLTARSIYPRILKWKLNFITKDNNNTENNDYSDASLITDLTDEFILFNQDILRKAANDKSRLEELAKQSSKKRNEDLG
ncbi:hypothetical protein CEXT_793701 [Caerostris extrusa]|uniref:Uncharacterized protein n=1 Tax=Caerostris extrusa TaxID=172846 RepID=A0AAV4NXE0_CAEEX|nr:hypothetical protein CEXT_793701 [Caerostris extrusa]